jgi:hypothetical protein
MYAQKCIYIVIFTTVHLRRSAKSTSCGRSRLQDPTFRGRTPTYQHSTCSNPRQSTQQCNDALTMLRSRRLRSQQRPRQTFTSCSEAHQKHQTLLQCGEHPSDDRSEHNARGTHSSASTQREGREQGSSVQKRPKRHGQRLQPRSAPNPESASQRPIPPIMPPIQASPTSFSSCRACEY